MREQETNELNEISHLNSTSFAANCKMSRFNHKFLRDEIIYLKTCFGSTL